MLSLDNFSNLPTPLKVIGALAAGTGVASIAGMVMDPENPFWKIILAGLVAVALLIALYVIFLKFRDKAKSGPFASLLSKAGARGAADPAQKARMDDLRKKFEEGVSTFKSAGKDVYSLPWFLLVGPSGSGKTEAMRHCNVGFPPGLQDCLQGTGGTLNMHWWFTNHAVVLDTAGRMFMEETAEGGTSEWKEFLKLLKQSRPNAPINGMLLVISAESLLKDSAEKIEQTAGAIARQLDVVQRTLDVRFPVFVFVTKCDKIVGFREFFDLLNDPALQHQMLGWSNPSPLDEAFKPDSVDKHLNGVREKLMKRRMGLMQNPVHTTDPTARRTDQVDELFELPDNLMRIAPRLRRYLELIFVAGEWSPKPLFLRGIYFTSSMREGQALDMTLASALGIDVESIPTGKQWDKDKAYFLRDVFLSKVFKEKGLVTKATNVKQHLRKQKTMLLTGSVAAVLILAGVAALGWTQFRSSLGPPSKFWKDVRAVYSGDEANEVTPFDLPVIAAGKDGAWTYRGGEKTDLDSIVEGSDVETRVDLLAETARWAGKRVDPPAIAVPVAAALGFRDGFAEDQMQAHRAVVENSVVLPLVQAARSKLQTEEQWGPEAVAALAQLVRLQTYAKGGTPLSAEPTLDAKGKPVAVKPVAIDVDPLFAYVLGADAYGAKDGYQRHKDAIAKAVAAAYPAGWNKDDKPSAVLGGADTGSVLVNSTAADRLVKHFLALGVTRGSQMDRLIKLRDGLAQFREQQRQLAAIQALRPVGAGETPAILARVSDYESFEQGFSERFEGLQIAKEQIDLQAEGLGPAANDPVGLFEQASEKLQGEIAQHFDLLLGQLPKAPGEDEEGKPLASKDAPELVELRDMLRAKSGEVATTVKTKLETLRGQVREVAPLMAYGRSEKADANAYRVIYDALNAGAEEVKAAKQAPAAPATGDELPFSFAAALEGLDADTAKASAAVSAWSSWTPDAASAKALSSDQQQSLGNERDSALRMARRAIEVAQSYRVYALAKKAIEVGPKETSELAGQVKQVADYRIGQGEAKRWTKPQVPLSDMEAGGEFDRQFHPDAAKEVLSGWTALRGMVEASSPGQRAMLGRDEFRASRDYRLGVGVADEYVQNYLLYWKNQALDAPEPTVATWDELGNKLKNVQHFDVKEELRKLRTVVQEAYAALPGAYAQSSGLESARQQVTDAFAMIDNDDFIDATRQTLTQWRRLSGSNVGAGRARETLLTAYADGVVGEQYFNVYRQSGRRVQWWNDFLEHSVDLLAKATGGDIIAARTTLLKSAGVPLAVGGNDLKDLTEAEVRQALDAVEKLDAAKGTGAAAANDRSAGDLPDPIREKIVRDLSGSDFTQRDQATRAWFDRVKVLARASAGKNGLAATVGYAKENPDPRLAGMGNARDEYRYAELYEGNTLKGKAFNIAANIDIPAAQAALLQVSYPSREPTRIMLYRTDPAQQQDPNPGEIVLPGPWGLLRQVCVDGGMAERDPTTGAWRVLTTTKDGKHYFFVTLKFNPDLPVRSEWPSAAAWPRE